MITEPAPIDDAAELTRYIESRYHARHREQLPTLAALAAKVETVHAGAAGVPAGLAVLLERMTAGMEAHMRKEEAILFPAIRAGGHPGLRHPIAVMRADHAGHDADLERIRALTDGPALPAGACRTWTRLYEALDEFIADLTEHMRLENEVLFPRFEPA